MTPGSFKWSAFPRNAEASAQKLANLQLEPTNYLATDITQVQPKFWTH